MNNFFIQLKTIARTIRLSTDEKQRMRVSLLTYIEQNPIEAPVPVASARAVPSPYLRYWFSPKFAVPLAVVLLVGLTSGTAFAARGSLPGDVLYPVKINVNEKMAVALATTPAQKAQVNADLATTRLEEAETLAANGKLDASISSSLTSNFTEHASAVEQTTTDLSQQDPGAAEELDAQFSSTLAAHTAILSEISADAKDQQTADNSNALAMAVSAHQHDEDNSDMDNSGDNQPVTIAVAMVAPATATPTATPAASARTFAAKANGARTMSAAATPEASTTVVKNGTTSDAEDAKGAARDMAIATSLQTQANINLALTRKDFEATKARLDAAAAASVQAQLDAAQANLVQASAALAQGNAQSARQQFNAVIRATVKLDTYLKVGKRLNLNILSALLGVAGVVSTSNSNGKGDSAQAQATSTATTSVVKPASSSADNQSGDNSQDGSGKGDEDTTNATMEGGVNLKLHL